MVIEAKYENGVFKPLTKVELEEGTVVELQSRLDKLKEAAEALLEDLAAELSATAGSIHPKRVDFSEEVRRFEMRLIRRALEMTEGDEARAARMLGLNMTTFSRKIKLYAAVEETQRRSRSLRDLAFAGMWANRADIKDGVSYVNTLRDSPRD